MDAWGALNDASAAPAPIRGPCCATGRLLDRVLTVLKERLLAPELVEEFVRAYVAEVNAANHDRGQLRARLGQECSKIGRHDRNLLELMTDGHGSPAIVQELRSLAQRQDALAQEIAVAATPELLCFGVQS
jgi:hypothetical protein